MLSHTCFLDVSRYHGKKVGKVISETGTPWSLVDKWNLTAMHRLTGRFVLYRGTLGVQTGSFGMSTRNNWHPAVRLTLLYGSVITH